MCSREKPLVSVIMPSYNRENTIAESIKSVLAQTYSDFELIIVDDGSSDGTVKVINSFKDKRIKLIALKENLGANKARNIGIEHASGEYIAFLDSDDCWRRNKLEIQLRYMKEKQLKVSFTPYSIKQNNGKEKIIPSNYLKYCDDADNIKKDLKLFNIIGTPTIIIEKDVLLEVGMFDNDLPRLQDYDLAIRIIQKYAIGCCPYILLDVGIQETRISTNQDILYIALGKIIEKHFQFIEFNTRNMIYGFIFNKYDELNENALEKIVENCYSQGKQFINCILNEQNSRMHRINGILNTINEINIQLLKDNSFVIWGAGEIGKDTLGFLKARGILPKYFVVSGQPETSAIDGIRVVNIKEIDASRFAVVLAVARKTQIEILENIELYNFKMIIHV